jgi:hypothetical protein
MTINTGGRDFEINCKHFVLNNSEEDNITQGHDFALHFGLAEEIFIGNKLEATAATAEEFSLSGALGVFLGLKEEFSLLATLEVILGLKQDYSAGIVLEGHSGLAFERNHGPKFELVNGAWIKKKDVELDTEVVKLVKGNIKVQDAILTLVG